MGIKYKEKHVLIIIGRNTITLFTQNVDNFVGVERIIKKVIHNVYTKC